ncbi:MAG: transposase family protein [Chloroflexi bacterium]|nr:MAG: transposase family protein [Chloroflexota bacterium]
MKTASIFSSTDNLGDLIELFLPAPQGLRMHQLVVTSDELILQLVSSRSEARCPVCGQMSARTHSHYQRTLQDLRF